MRKNADILVIDDEPVVVNAVSRITQAENFSVDTASFGEEGLSKLRENSYKLVLCDIMMSDLDGFHILQFLDKCENNTPIIMMTGYSTVENAVKSLSGGAIDFIPKPFTAEELIGAIRRGLKYRDLQIKLIHNNLQKGMRVPVYIPCPSTYSRLGYSSWMVKESVGSAKIGVTNLFTKTIESLVSIKFSETDQEIAQGTVCAHIEDAGNLMHSILSPLSGKILERNDVLLNDIKILEKDPYFRGWIYRIIPVDFDYEIKHLVPCSSDRI